MSKSFFIFLFNFQVAHFIKHELNNVGEFRLTFGGELFDERNPHAIGFLDIGHFYEYVEFEQFFNYLTQYLLVNLRTFSSASSNGLKIM